MFQPVKFDQAEAVKANGGNSQFFDGNTEQLVKIVQTDIKGAPKFKVDDKVYVGLTGRIAQVTEIIDDDVVSVANKNNEVRAWVSNICHATQENYERLQATFTDIEFEQPSKPLFVE